MEDVIPEFTLILEGKVRRLKRNSCLCNCNHLTSDTSISLCLSDTEHFQGFQNTTYKTTWNNNGEDHRWRHCAQLIPLVITSHSTPRNTVLEKLASLKWSTHSLPFIEPRESLLCWQEPSTGCYPYPDQTTPHSCALHQNLNVRGVSIFSSPNYV